MTALYLDTSALVKLYVAEPETGSLSTFVARQTRPLPYTSLHELEFTQAIERRLAAGDLEPRQASEIRAMIERDLAQNILSREEIAWPAAFGGAIGLLRRHGRKHGLRSLDSLHVACALTNKDHIFVTFDRRQSSVAKAEKLKVWPSEVV